MGPTSHAASTPGEPNWSSKPALAPRNFLEEHQALEQLIASGEFHRSPNLEKILKYLCNQYFLGLGNQVKEYTVATEALERKEDFDPKRDSIVRVEMHRLRRRLKEHYATRGADALMRISIPDKSYIPEFIAAPKSESGELVPAGDGLPTETDSVWIRVRKHNFVDVRIVIPVLVGMALLAVTGLWYQQRDARPAEAAPSAPAASQPATLASTVEPRLSPVPVNGSEYRILAGRAKGRYPDRYGVIWQGDDFFTGGTAVTVENEVRARGFDSNLFANKREGDFEYAIPLNPGSYELTLLFAETSFGEGNVFGGGESNRQFHIHVNGRTELSGLDVLSEAHDTNTATARMFKDMSPAKDGKLHIRFESSLTGKAFVNAILIRPGVPGQIRPIRIVCRPHIYKDINGDIWEPDRYYRGGIQITRPNGAPNVRDPDLYRGERYGKFTYSIPVPPGKYQARMFFTEYWWGPDRPGGGGTRSRVFDVFCNFKPLLLNFDLYKLSPVGRVRIETFRGLEPNLSSELVFDFEPHVNYALINAIEITADGVALPNH